MLTLLRSVIKVFRSLQSDVAPASIAGGVAIGCVMGLMPFGAQTVLLLLLLLIVRVNVSVGLLAAALMKLLHVAVLAHVGLPLGRFLLAEGRVTRSFFVQLLEAPVIGLVPFEEHAVTGGAVLGVALGGAAFWPVMKGVRAYRATLKARLDQSRAGKVLARGWFTKTLDWLLRGAGAAT